MRATVHTLAPDCLEFLQRVDRTSGRSAAGVFVRRRGLRPGPRSGRWPRLVFGLILIAASLAPVFLAGQVLTLGNKGWLPWVQVVLAAGGLLLLAGAVLRFMRKPLPTEFDSFLFADGTSLWEVNRDQIRAWPLADLVEMDGRITHSQSGTTFSLTLYFRREQWYRTFDARGPVERLLAFLSVQKNMRNADDADIRMLAEVAPGRFAALAEAIANKSGTGDLDVRPNNPDPPTPAEVEAAADAPGRLPAVLAWAGGGVAAVGWAVGLPLADTFALDGATFARVPTALSGTWPDHDTYLSHFPNGRFAGEVKDRRDDQRYHLAETTAARQDSPAALRDYLKDEANTRHRPEAKDRIAVFYDRVIVDLKARSAKGGLAIDPKMFAAVIALIEGMKGADRPVVTVGFSGKIDPLPTTDAGRKAEKTEYDLYLDATPELKGVADRQVGKSAILPHKEAFDASQKEKREDLILGHLRAALNQVVKQEVLAVEKAKPGEAAVLEVGYHIQPSGGLYIYTSPNQFGGGKTVNGLLRGYQVGWAITVRPPAAEKTYLWELKSEALLSLRYSQEPGDPDWAPYAIILYSAFHDMGGRLVSNFAVTPPKAPNVWTYSAVSSSRADDDPPNPLRPGKKPWEK